jgi:hypothetical protein
MYLQKVKNLLFVDILKATDKKSMIRIRSTDSQIRIRTKMSRIHNTACDKFKSKTRN